MTHQKNDRLRIIDNDEKSADDDIVFSVSQHKRRRLVSALTECQQSFLPDTTSPTSTTTPFTTHVPSHDSFDCICPTSTTIPFTHHVPSRDSFDCICPTSTTIPFTHHVPSRDSFDRIRPTSTTIPFTHHVPSLDSFDRILPRVHTLNVQFNLYPAAVQQQLHDATTIFDSPKNAAVPGPNHRHKKIQMLDFVDSICPPVKMRTPVAGGMLNNLACGVGDDAGESLAVEFLEEESPSSQMSDLTQMTLFPEAFARGATSVARVPVTHKLMAMTKMEVYWYEVTSVGTNIAKRTKGGRTVRRKCHVCKGKHAIIA